MVSVRHILAMIALAGLAACGGGSTPAVTTGSVQPSTSGGVANATAQITFKFPTTFSVAKRAGASVARASIAASRRSPSYINPTSGDYLNVQVNGTLVNNPATGTPSFGLGTQNADGSSTITVPITSGSYFDGEIVISEYDALSNLIAQGSNQPYEDAFGNDNSGTLTVTPGSSAALQIIMNMNAQYVVLTTDPVSGSDAIAITSWEQCFPVTPGHVVYAFAGDDSLGFVLPGTASGFGGGYQEGTVYPGIPPVTIFQQTSTSIGGTSELSSSPPGWIFVYDGTYGVNVDFQFTNPLSGNTVSALAQINTPGNCG